MRLTVLTCTYRREPQFRWIADSLAHQLRPRIQVEWVIVDGFLFDTHPPEQRAARRQAVHLAVNGRMEYLHIAPKPTRWQGPARMTRSDYYALNNARNTGLIVASGTSVALCDDCSVLDQDWLERHVLWAEQGKGVCGTYCTFQTATVDNGHILQSDPSVYGWDSRLNDPNVAAGPCIAPPGWGYGLNTSFPIDVAEKVGGFDEMYDGFPGVEDCDFHIRTVRAGLESWFDPFCAMYQILQTHEAVCGHAGWGQPTRRQKELVLRADGKAHYAGEALVERLMLDEPTRTRPLADWFDLRSARAAWRLTGLVPANPLGPTTHWVDGQPLAEME